MSNTLARTTLQEPGDHSRLFAAYADNPARGLSPWLPGYSSDRAFWERAAGTRAAGTGSETWERVIDEVHGLSAGLGACDEVLQRLRRAKDRETLFVVTGQQPGVLGGPLLAIYKAVTAVALAARLETLLGRPCVPLYWCGGDDADFQEIRRFSCLQSDGTPFGASMSQDAHTAGMPTGDIALEWPRQIWDGIEPFIRGFEYGAYVESLVERSFERAGDNGELTSAILTGLAGGGLAVVDGRSAAVRRHAGALIAAYVENESEIKTEITERGGELEAAGYHAQLSVGVDSGVFLLEDGLRKNVTEDLRPRLLAAARRAPESCSPGVALRNLVQDAVFNPIAVVLGPAEIAYRAQLSGVYDRFEIQPPAAIPRMTATYFPPGLASIFEVLGSDLNVEAALTNPSAFAGQVYEKSIPETTAKAARELTDRVNDAVNEFSRSIGEKTSKKAMARLRSRLGDLQSRTAQATGAVAEIGKAVALEQWPFLPELSAIVRPGDKPQERLLSVLVPFLFGGDAMLGGLAATAREYTDDLLDGRANHIVYSSK